MIPEELRSGVLEKSHDPPQSGHFGCLKTLDLVEKYYFRPGICYDVAKSVKTCDTCHGVESLETGLRGLTSPKKYEQPEYVVCCDSMGPFSPSKNRNYYIFIGQDEFTKFIVLKRLRSADGPLIM